MLYSLQKTLWDASCTSAPPWRGEVCFTTTWRQIWNIKSLLFGFLTWFFLSSRYFPAMRPDGKLLLVGRWRFHTSSIRLNHTSTSTRAVVVFFKPTACGCTYWYDACIDYCVYACVLVSLPVCSSDANTFMPQHFSCLLLYLYLKLYTVISIKTFPAACH